MRRKTQLLAESLGMQTLAQVEGTIRHETERLATMFRVNLFGPQETVQLNMKAIIGIKTSTQYGSPVINDYYR